MVRRFIFLPLLFSLCALAGCATRSTVPASPAELTSETGLPNFAPPVPEEWKMANGITVLFLRDKELPVVSASLFTRGGSLWEEEADTGLSSAMGELMRGGGAGERSADELDEELVRLSASIGSSVGAEFGSVSFSCLTSDLDTVFSMFADVVRRPRFDPYRLALWKSHSMEGILRRGDDPATVAGITFSQILYADSAYGRVLERRHVEGVSRDKLIKRYGELIRPDDAILVISGDTTREEVQALLERSFGDWKATGRALPPPPKLGAKPTPGIYYIELPFSQAFVMAGHLGVPRFTSDYVAIDAFNQLFGSGFFGARLMKKLRAELGLVYGIFGGVYSGLERGKAFVAFQTKGESAGEAIAASIDELIAIQSEPPPTTELADVQHAVASSFIFRFDSTDKVLTRRASQTLLGYPPNYDETYLPTLLQTKPEELQTVAKKHWNLNDLVIVVAGDKNAYTSLTKLIREPLLKHPSSGGVRAWLEQQKIRTVAFNQKADL